MPDPVECLLAMLAAAGLSAAVALPFGRRWQANQAVVKATGIVACMSGTVGGYAVLGLHPAWPPASALDRFLTAVLPAVIVVELLAAAPWMAGKITASLRFVLALAMARVLLHGSVYLAVRDGGRGDVLFTTAWLVVGGLAIAASWHLLLLLHRRSSCSSLPLTLALAIACSGTAILFAGYIRGGEAAFPVAAALAATALASAGLKRPADEGLIGVGVVGLAGLLIVGHFFGRLTTGQAVAVFSSPLMCWIAELPTFRAIKPWQAVALRLLLTAIPLIVVLALAMYDFRSEMQQLLVSDD